MQGIPRSRMYAVLSFLVLLSVISLTDAKPPSSRRAGGAIVQAEAAAIPEPPTESYVNPFVVATKAAKILSEDERPPECPPCFNCNNPNQACQQFGDCSRYDGTCSCPPGYGGRDCGQPLCGSLDQDPRDRMPPDGYGDNPVGEAGPRCQCADGWTGLNCNVCTADKVCDKLMPNEMNGTCYAGGALVKKNYHQCTVTNRKIIDLLPDRKPEVTFACDEPKKACDFQFWIGNIESFYCKLLNATFTYDVTFEQNITKYAAETIECRCIPGKMLCGEEGSIDISDFLSEEIKGPGSLTCKSQEGCVFSEPAMNGLINDVFGDRSITLDCLHGECLHYSEVPGYRRPEAPPTSTTTKIVWSAVGILLFLAVLVVILWLASRQSKHEETGNIKLPDDEAAKLMTDHTPAALHFRNVTYSVNGQVILKDITGSIRPGEIMAVVGASGAGKSTFLDILGRKSKRGMVGGEVLVNGRKLSDDSFKMVSGFVDQEDTLMPTLTVYEAVLYSALLRLPNDMSIQAKIIRTLETLAELGILAIKDSRIGESGKRSISGGEKRRVSIACELVTSPSILFLDEPTSGLDAYNAYNVVESLVTLARNYQRTIIFSIHQPRSNIVALFDKLVLLANGRMVYSGAYQDCQEYFDSIGHKCPPGFNIADYLVDLTMHAARLSASTPSEVRVDRMEDSPTAPGDSSHSQEPRPAITRGLSLREQQEAMLYSPRFNLMKLGKAHQNEDNSREASGSETSSTRGSLDRAAHLEMLMTAFTESAIARRNLEDIELAQRSAQLPDVEAKLRGLSGRKAGYLTQFRILSGRTFKNLHRNPMLLLSHYLLSLFLAAFCGILFAHLQYDISGFQNRMGLFFFILALFGFSALTSLNVFANERILFMRERANGYYSPFIYFVSKVLFDIVPLRVVPPLLLGTIVYHIVGLVDGLAEFWCFQLTIVLFNLSAAGICLLLGILLPEPGIANLAGSVVMLFSLLMAGLLLNHNSITPGLKWLQSLSLFHYGFEALLVNEVKYLTLTEKKYGLEIEVPGATILSTFGFEAQAFWKDIICLVIYFGVTITLSFLGLLVFVRERR